MISRGSKIVHDECQEDGGLFVSPEGKAAEEVEVVV
jgi:hypothetical protein